MKSYFLGFLGGISALILMGAATPISNNFDQHSALFNELTNLYKTVQAKQFQVYAGTPTVNLLNERELVIVSTGTISVFTKIAGSTYSVTLERK